MKNKNLAILYVSLCVLFCTGFSWSLLFGDLQWQDVDEEIQRKYPHVPSVSVDELRGMSSSTILLVDVREPEEYVVSHIPGAVSRDRVDPEGLPRDALIIAYCSVGLRSAGYAHDLKNKGFTNVYNLKGSIFEWGNRGYPLMSREGLAGYVHPYNRRWGVLLKKELHSYGHGR